ncbi:ABC transporter ATP-binding protein [Christiangramia sp. OXR-203]|uniref:ABC transporter ATP-binding protein n=1 Tax=Christiangramia sp. OXR-203 TaxID=3100176 RepID=UPI002AC8ED36|nr:ABC transporter ATP-binding protein [Christiangramia sp. OXR-203]WPY99766.1 ABC transporter ATP-binding protein [Christiangramia sp. OXR-203]
MAKILRVENLSKTYNNGNRKLVILDKINFDIEEGETFAIVGPSGSGKTTLLGLSAGLDRSDEGTIELCGENLSELDEDDRAALRNRHVGFVFQNFQLIPTLTALENVAVPLELRGDSSAENEATALLEKVGLKDRMNHYPTQLSGGEQQRVALARAFCNKPKILFADEPTGNLDEATGQNVIDLLLTLNKDLGTTLVIVTHDMELAKKTQRILKLRGGKVQELQIQE